jgi:muramidase (phage lysozyme)
MTVYAFDPTPEERSILGQIRNYQSNGQYNVLCGSTPNNPKKFTGWTAFPQWSGVVINGVTSHAAGAFQFEPETWQGVVAATQAPDFSPTSQDIGALWLLRNYSQESQWGTNFVDDGFWYMFQA